MGRGAENGRHNASAWRGSGEKIVDIKIMQGVLSQFELKTRKVFTHLYPRHILDLTNPLLLAPLSNFFQHSLSFWK